MKLVCYAVIYRTLCCKIRIPNDKIYHTICNISKIHWTCFMYPSGKTNLRLTFKVTNTMRYLNSYKSRQDKKRPFFTKVSINKMSELKSQCHFRMSSSRFFIIDWLWLFYFLPDCSGAVGRVWLTRQGCLPDDARYQSACHQLVAGEEDGHTFQILLFHFKVFYAYLSMWT